MRRSRPVVIMFFAGSLLLSATGVLAGCGQQTGTDEAASTGTAPAAGEVTSAASSPATSAASSPASSPASSAAPVASSASAGGGQPFPGDTSADTADPVAPEGLTVTDVRIGTHDGHDRVVLDVAGEGTPGWDVQYVAEATAEGTGDPIDLAGPAYLRVLLTGVTNPYESGVEERPRGAVTAPGATAVTGAWYDGTFEGQALAYVGTAAERPFRVYTLTGPTRVVIEVAGD